MRHSPTSTSTERFAGKTFTDQDLEDFLVENAEIFDLPNSQLGGWFDIDTGRFVLDVTFPIKSLQDALDIATSADQDATFDVSTITENHTKKDGQPIRPATAEGVRQIDPRILPQAASEASWGGQESLGEEGRAVLARRDADPSSAGAVRRAFDEKRGDASQGAASPIDAFPRGSTGTDERRSEAFRGGAVRIDHLPPGLERDPDSEGNEHHVWYDHSLRRVWKLAKRRRSYGVSDDAREYLQRWEGQNAYWKDDVRVEGFMPDGRVLISQPFVEGSHPTRGELHRRLEALGWKMYQTSGNVWESADGRVVMKDAHTGNFVIEKDDTLRAIDVNLMSMDEFLQYEDDEWVEPDTRLSDIIEQNLTPRRISSGTHETVSASTRVETSPRSATSPPL